MTKSNYPDYRRYLSEQVILPFYQKRIDSLKSLKLQHVLCRKNPYLLKVKNLEIAGDLVRSIIDAFLSSQQEILFGNLLEGFAVYVAENLYQAFKSQMASIDLELQRNGEYYIVSIKSGVHRGNSDQKAKMQDNFKKAKNILCRKGVNLTVIAVNGCIYGKNKSSEKTNQNLDKVYYR